MLFNGMLLLPFVFGLLLTRSWAEESECACDVSCPGLFIDCADNGGTNPTSGCGVTDVSCPDTLKAQNWALNASRACTCPAYKTGFQCNLDTPNKCGNGTLYPDLVFDGTMLNYATDKTIQCIIPYDPTSAINGFLTLVDHRVDIVVYEPDDPTSATTTGRFVLYSRPSTGSDLCGPMTKMMACDVSECSGAKLENDPDGREVAYTCAQQTCTTCASSACSTWKFLLTQIAGKPFRFAFAGQNTAAGLANGSFVIDVGGEFNLPLVCSTGQCVEEIRQNLIVIPPKDHTDLLIAGVIVGAIVFFVVVFGFAGMVLGRRIGASPELQPLLVPLDGSQKSKSEVKHTHTNYGGQGQVEDLTLPGAFRKDSDSDDKNREDGSTPPDTSSTLGAILPTHRLTSTGDDRNAIELEAPLPSVPEGGCGLVFEDLSYTIQLPNQKTRRVLDGITGLIRPGEFVAIVGPSGAGKSTLLNILSGYERRLAGTIEGSVNFYGNIRGARQEVVSYVLQEDVLIPTETVREALMFSAVLRSNPSSTQQDREKTVAGVLKELGIEEIAESMIGDPSRGGISGGERRRVAIGVELVTRPGLLILDEPTSGLDSYKVGTLLKLLQSVSRQGIAVILSIHQMTPRHFKMFDKLLLLTKQGTVGFFGKPTQGPEFLETLAMPVPGDENPADYLLTAVSGPANAALISKSFATSSYGEKLAEEVKNAQRVRKQLLSESAATNQPVGRPSQNRFVQFWYLTVRSYKYVARAPIVVFSSLLFAIGMSIILGCVFYKVDNGLPGTQNRAGVLFFMVIYFSLTAVSALGLFITHRPTFEKEHSAGYYTSGCFFWSQVVADITTLRIIPPLVFGLICYFLIGFQEKWDHFLVFLCLLVLLHVVAAAWCAFVSAACKNMAQAELCAVIFLVFAMIWGGNFLNNSTDNPLLELRYLSFCQYAYEAMFVNEFHGLDLLLNPVGLPVTKITGDVIIANFGMKWANRGFDVMILFFWGVGFLLIAFAVLQYTSRLKRVKRGSLDE